MIEVKYRDRLGNKLFQYCFGRILANKLGFSLKADPIDGFEGTKDIISGISINTPEVILRKHRVKIDRIDTLNKITIDGWFQRWEYYRDNENDIRKWLKFEPVNDYLGVGPDDIIAHMRLGDYYHKHKRSMKHEFYNHALKLSKFDRLFICTDEPNNRKYLDEFNKYNPIIINHNELDTIKYMALFNKIILSMSTFSWWGAFFSNASEIYYPLLKEDRGGCWGQDTNIDLRVNSPRYIYIPDQLTIKD